MMKSLDCHKKADVNFYLKKREDSKRLQVHNERKLGLFFSSENKKKKEKTKQDFQCNFDAVSCTASKRSSLG